MRFSKKIDYGLIFLSCLAKDYHKNSPVLKTGDFVTIKEVSEEFGVPYSFMEKIASALKTAGMIGAKKGKDGGYFLTRAPKSISLEEVMTSLEKPKTMQCLEKGAAPCFLMAKCPTRRRWEILDKKILKVFSETTLAEI